jgi:isocitrate/isopropylmalate dehydrogenase
MLYARHCTRDEDMHGIDVVILTEDVGRLYLQVKSSEAGRQKFMSRRRPVVSEVVVVGLHDSDEVVRSAAIEAMRRARSKVLAKRDAGVEASEER